MQIFGNILLVRNKAGAEAASRVQAVYTGDDALSSGDYRCRAEQCDVHSMIYISAVH
jgi:hypothetical protein